MIGVHLNSGGDDAAKVKEVMTREKLPWRTFVDDGAIVAKWKPSGTPSFYIIDPKGVIRYKWAGAPAGETMDVAIEMLLHETEGDAKEPPK